MRLPRAYLLVGACWLFFQDRPPDTVRAESSDSTESAFAGLVSAATPEATAAGVEVLRAGGNAIDAAVATAFALAVTEPFGSGLGGQMVLIVHPPKASPFVINGSSFSPRGVPKDARARDLVGRRATTIPTTVKVLGFAWRRCGSGKLTWAQLVQPAIRFAEHGYKIGSYHARVLERYEDVLRTEPTVAASLLLESAAAPAEGSRFKQPLLAATLERLALNGCEDFYSGSIARQIAADMVANAGWIRLRDLKELPEPRVLAPLKGVYRGWDVYTLPPPFGGWVVLQALEVLEHAPAEQLRANAPNRIVWLAEALRIAHRSRLESPVADLVKYQAAIRKRLGDSTIQKLRRSFERPGVGETTHFSVVDRQGMAVSASASINSFFGAKVAHPKLGFLYNDYMRDFVTDDDDHPFALEPSSMAYSSMSATILSRDGKVGLVLGSPGSKRIISTVVQVISHWVDGGQDVARAIAGPRIHVIPDEDLYVEHDRLTRQQLVELERRGFWVARPFSSLGSRQLNPYFGGVHAIARGTSGWRAAADPRRDGAVGTPSE